MAERDERAAPEVAAEDGWGRREPGDDFFCLRYRIWYPSFDCAVRTKFRTAPGCARCDQGLFNFKRHAPDLLRVRFPVHRFEPDEQANEA